MKIRIVVANQSEAHFYDSLGGTRRLAPAGSLLNPQGRMHDQDLDADRPGRVFRFGGNSAQRRGASTRHGTDGNRSTHQHIVEKFARRVATELAHGLAARRFDRVVLVAAPAFLGRLRRSLPASLRARVAAAVPRDLITQPDNDLLAYLPRSVFSGEFALPPARRILARSIA